MAQQTANGLPALARPARSPAVMARANEQYVATVELATEDIANPESVAIFKSSDERFRILISSSIGGERTFTQQTVYTSEDKLIPRYALPTLATTGCLEMAIFSRSEETLFRFSAMKQLLEFQTAMTGYDISHDQRDIRCQFSDEVSFLDCVGRLQLWQEPILLPPQDSMQHPFSTRSRDSFAGSTYDRGESLMPSVAPTNTVSWTTGGWEADNIKLPVLTIYTQLMDKKKKAKFATIFVPLQRGVYIDASECSCGQDYRTCSKLVLVHEKKPDFTVRTLYSETEPSGNPNPNTFDIFPFRLSKHPRFKDIVVKQTKYLVLKFKSLPEKQSFHRELDLRFRVRDKQIMDQRRFADHIKQRQDRPEGRRRMMDGSVDAFSQHDSSYAPSLPPILDVPDIGPALGDTITAGARSPSIRPATSYVDVRSVASSNSGGNMPPPLPANHPEIRSILSASSVQSSHLPPPSPLSHASARSPVPSARSNESKCTSLDSMVLSNRDDEKIDYYLH
jgi:hypothetical protein